MGQWRSGRRIAITSCNILNLFNFTHPLKIFSLCHVRSLNYDVAYQVLFRRNGEIKRSIASWSLFLLSIATYMYIHTRNTQCPGRYRGSTSPHLHISIIIIIITSLSSSSSHLYHHHHHISTSPDVSECARCRSVMCVIWRAV